MMAVKRCLLCCCFSKVELTENTFKYIWNESVLGFSFFEFGVQMRLNTG